MEPSQHRFGPFRLDPTDRCLWRGEERVHLNPKAFAVLRCLVERAGQLVTKAQLLEAVWPQTAVVEAVLTTAVREIRQALGDRARAPKYVETVHGRGYRFVASMADAGGGTGLVGRIEERRALRRWFDAARAGQRGTVFVAGEAGIGKSTLIDAFVDEVGRTDGAMVGRGQCIEPHGAAEPYLPVLEALTRLGRAAPALGEVIARFAPTWLVHLPAFADGPAAKAPAPPSRLLRELAEAMEALSHARPLVLVLEDLHWSDASTLQWLAYVSRRRDPACLLILATYRPVEAIAFGNSLRAVVAELRSHPRAAEIMLDVLPSRDVAALLSLRYGALDAKLELASVLHRRTRGHPLFATAILESLEQSSLLAKHEGAWRLRARPEEIEAIVPDSVRAYVERRFEVLDREERSLLEAAAVAGHRPCLAAVAAAVDVSEEQADATLGPCLDRGELIEDDGVERWPDGTRTQRLCFRHGLYQQALYRRMPAGRRGRLHGRIAARIEAAFGVDAPARATELGAHFEAAGDARKAARYWGIAARTARRRSAYVEADSLIDRGRACLDDVPAGGDRDAVELQLCLEGTVLAMLTHGWGAPGVEPSTERALALARRLEDDDLLVRARFNALGFRLVRGQYLRHRELSEALEATALRRGDEPALVVARIELGGAAFARGDLAAADEAFAAGLAAYRDDHHDELVERFGLDFGVFGWGWWSHLSWHRGAEADARAQSQRAFGLASERGHPMTLVAARAYAAMLHQYLGEAAVAREHAEHALDLSLEYGHRYYEAWATICLAWARSAQGDDGGLDAMQRAIHGLMDAGARRLLPYFWSVYAEACLRAGRREDARRALRSAFEVFEATEERAWAPELHRLQSRVAGPGAPAAASSRQEARREAIRQGATGLLRRIDVDAEA